MAVRRIFFWKFESSQPSHGVGSPRTEIQGAAGRGAPRRATLSDLTRLIFRKMLSRRSRDEDVMIFSRSEPSFVPAMPNQTIEGLAAPQAPWLAAHCVQF